MAWNPFRKKKDEDSLESNNLDKKIDEALTNAKNDRREAEKDIDKIRSWTAEVIIDAYAHLFPNGNLTYYREKYKDDAIANYEQIKNDNAGKISQEKADKCEKLVAGYLHQIGLRESKLKLYEKLENEYKKTKDKLKKVSVVKQSDEKLDTHEDRLRMLDSDTDTYVDAVSDTAKLEELKKEFELKSEYVNQLALLSDKYDTESSESYNNAEAFKEEVDKLIDDIE
ncbi:MAG: hypothetical protein GY756_02470 [bacterium]|nr:hypothetical protein [bacterium]